MIPTKNQKLTVDVVIPVYNEEKALPKSIFQLSSFLAKNLSCRWRIIIADNASIDKTPEVGKGLAQENNGVFYTRLNEKGRGRALRKTWSESKADVLSYMDVDLSTNLDAFPELINRIINDKFDIAIGSRLKKGAHTTRQWKREIISRCYNLMIKAFFPSRTFSDAQCGFKAISHRASKKLLPNIKNNEWFFDSELLLRAEQYGFKIAEVPVEWIEDLDTRVNIIKTAVEDIKGLFRVRFTS